MYCITWNQVNGFCTDCLHWDYNIITEPFCSLALYREYPIDLPCVMTIHNYKLVTAFVMMKVIIRRKTTGSYDIFVCMKSHIYVKME